MNRRFLALLLVTLASASKADNPASALNLCSKTRQTVVNQVDVSITEAAAAGIVEKVRSALKAGTSPNSTDSEGFSLLHIALTENQDGVLDLLLKAGVDVNQPFMGSSPLSLARMSMSSEASAAPSKVDKLVKAGAVLSDFDNAFFAVTKLGFKSHTAGFVDSITRGDQIRLDLYVRSTYDINAPISDGVSPLHIAAIQGTPDAIRYLVKCGANVNARTARGAPVLWFAKDRPEAKRLLVELGAVEKD